MREWWEYQRALWGNAGREALAFYVRHLRWEAALVILTAAGGGVYGYLANQELSETLIPGFWGACTGLLIALLLAPMVSRWMAPYRTFRATKEEWESMWSKLHVAESKLKEIGSPKRNLDIVGAFHHIYPSSGLKRRFGPQCDFSEMPKANQNEAMEIIAKMIRQATLDEVITVWGRADSDAPFVEIPKDHWPYIEIHMWSGSAYGKRDGESISYAKVEFCSEQIHNANWTTYVD